MLAVFNRYLNNTVDTEKRTEKCLGVILQKPESMFLSDGGVQERTRGVLWRTRRSFVLIRLIRPWGRPSKNQSVED